MKKDLSQAKVLLMEEYTSKNKRSDKEIVAFHAGMNYLIDYLDESNGRLNDYIPDETLYSQRTENNVIKLLEKEVAQMKLDMKELQTSFKESVDKINFKNRAKGKDKHILVIMDAFKGCLSSTEAGEAVVKGIRTALPHASVHHMPMSDGGEGMVDALLTAKGGTKVRLVLNGPLMQLREAFYGISDDKQTAYIEIADICGLPLVPTEQRNPLLTTSYGVGEAIMHALNHGCRNIVVGLGGSATNDVGVGMLQALGYRFLDKRGNELPAGCGGMLERIITIDDSDVSPLLEQATFNVLCDVDNPLCGKKGTVKVFAPQKGAVTAKMLKTLENGVTHFADLTSTHIGIDMRDDAYTGAAGGLAFALGSYLHATFHSGIQYMLKQSNFTGFLPNTHVIITGEGKADRQTLMGKTPFGIL
ncbi:MAG: glycerate kinase, partial [Mediterranea sp.]|nr:glycerate kinase [Mediterranea sp.]